MLKKALLRTLTTVADSQNRPFSNKVKDKIDDKACNFLRILMMQDPNFDGSEFLSTQECTHELTGK